MKEKLVTAIADMKEEAAMSLARAMLDKGEDPQAILDAGSKAMTFIGNRYDAGEYFLPELILAGDMMKQLGDLVRRNRSARLSLAR
jgi:methanogenic corrinoid protein MtbC1